MSGNTTTGGNTVGGSTGVYVHCVLHQPPVDSHECIPPVDVHDENQWKILSYITLKIVVTIKSFPFPFVHSITGDSQEKETKVTLDIDMISVVPLNVILHFTPLRGMCQLRFLATP